jgi:hypothetical protein
MRRSSGKTAGLLRLNPKRHERYNRRERHFPRENREKFVDHALIAMTFNGRLDRPGQKP